jgi:hypothetical protein
MPNRILREGILHSPRMARLGWAEEVFYRRLHSVVDDFGRYYADPGLLRAACYPRQLNKVSDPDIGKWLRSCADAGLVRVYPAEDGERYLEVLDFGQQVRAKKSKFPEAHSACAANATQPQSNVPSLAHLGVSVSGLVSEEAKASSSSPGATDRPTIPCPYEAIRDAYHAALPTLPKAKLMPAKRKEAMRKLWAWVLSSRKSDGQRRASNGDEALAWIAGYFAHASRSDFLMGRTARSAEHAGWECDIDFLMTDKGMKHVIEKTAEAA